MKFKLLLLGGMFLFLISTWIGVLFYGILLAIIFADIIIEILGYIGISKRQERFHPNGISVEFCDVWFQFMVDEYKWNKVKWEDVSLVFDNKIIGNISLYNSKTKEFHLIFRDRENDDMFMQFRELVMSKQKRIY